MNTCPDCNRLTGGYCWRHSTWPFISVESSGHWIYHPDPICARCRKPSPCTAILPYGSRYDGEHLCADCIKEIVDPEIDRTWIAPDEHR